MTRRPAFRNSVLPFGFQPAEFIEAHKNGVKRSGGNAAVARDGKSYLRCLGNGQTAATIPAVRIRLTTAGEKASNTLVVYYSPSREEKLLVYELSRIADALDRISNRPVDQYVAAPSRETDESTGGRIPLSMFGR